VGWQRVISKNFICFNALMIYVAERVGFEPTVHFAGQHGADQQRWYRGPHQFRNGPPNLGGAPRGRSCFQESVVTTLSFARENLRQASISVVHL
jgi:hypothetical protein